MTEVLNNPGFYVSYAVVQAIIILLLIRLADPYGREPLGLLAVMVGWGATGAALIALAGNRAVRAMLSDNARDVFGNAIAPPLVEEAPEGAEPRPATVGAKEDAQRPWWRRVFGG